MIILYKIVRDFAYSRYIQMVYIKAVMNYQLAKQQSLLILL